MPKTSTYGGFIRYSAAQFGEKPFWAGFARDHLINNANHITDEAGQVLVNWCMTTTSTYLTPVMSGGLLILADTYYRICRFGPVPLLMQPDGSSRLLRGRLRGYLGNAATATYRMVVSAASESLRVRDDTAAPNAFTFTTTGTTDAWRDADTDNVCSLSAEDMAAAAQTLSALSAVGGDAISVQVPLVVVDVYAKSTSTGSVPRLTGLYLAEYV